MKKIKKWLIIFIATIYSSRKTKNTKKINTILISARFKIGDTLMLFPLIRELKKNNSDIQIDILTGKDNDFMFKNNPYVNNVYTLYKGINFFKFSIKYWFEMKKNNYDLVIESFPIKFENFVYYALLGAKNYASENYPNRYDVDLEKMNFFQIIYANKKQFYADRFLDYLHFFGFKAKNRSLEVYIGDQNIAEARNFFQKFRNKTKILINIDGSAKERCIYKKEYMYLIEELRKTSEDIVVFIISLPERRKEVEDNVMSMDNVHQVYPTLNIFQVMAIVQEIDIVITPDTSVLHIANALNKKIVGIYSNNNENFHMFSDLKYDKLKIVKSKHSKINSIQGFDKDLTLSYVKNFLEKTGNKNVNK